MLPTSGLSTCHNVNPFFSYLSFIYRIPSLTSSTLVYCNHGHRPYAHNLYRTSHHVFGPGIRRRTTTKSSASNSRTESTRGYLCRDEWLHNHSAERASAPYRKVSLLCTQYLRIQRHIRLINPLPSTLIRDRESAFLSDMIIECQNIEFPCHKAIVCAQSPTIRACVQKAPVIAVCNSSLHPPVIL